MSYDNTNRGQIWKNDKKEKDTHPDFRGSLNVDGVEYWVSAWKRKADANPKAPALSFSVQREESQGGAPDKPRSEAGSQDFDDEVPFISADPRFDVEWRR